MQRKIALLLPVLNLDLAGVMSTNFYDSKFASESFRG